MGDNLFNVEIQTDDMMEDRNKLVIKISNYRSIEYLEITLDSFTQLIGQNNCGKSNILFAIKQAINKEKVQEKDFLNEEKDISISVNKWVYIAKKPGDSFSCEGLKKIQRNR